MDELANHADRDRKDDPCTGMEPLDMRMKKPRPQESEQPLMSTGQFGEELARIMDQTLPLAVLYAKALEEGGWPPGGSGVHVSGGSPSDATLAAFSGPWQRRRREHARRAVKFVKQAQRALERAEDVLTGEVVQQPEKVDRRATITQEEFDRRREHRRREEELRR
jgi:hypothetical protein